MSINSTIMFVYFFPVFWRKKAKRVFAQTKDVLGTGTINRVVATDTRVSGSNQQIV